MSSGSPVLDVRNLSQSDFRYGAPGCSSRLCLQSFFDKQPLIKKYCLVYKRLVHFVTSIHPIDIGVLCRLLTFLNLPG